MAAVNRKSWIVVDLDGTLCDCAHRVHWAQAKDWDRFHAGIPEDKVNEDVLTLLNMVPLGFGVLVCTGRDERNRMATEKWLHDQGVAHLIDYMVMRPEKDFSSDHDLKPRLVAEFFGSMEKALEKVVFILDDRDGVVESFRNAGFKCWQVAVGSY